MTISLRKTLLRFWCSLLLLSPIFFSVVHAEEPAISPSKDLVFYVGNGSESLKFIRTANGEASVSSGRNLRDGISWCVATQSSFSDISKRDQLVVISSEIRWLLKQQLGQDVAISSSKLVACVHDSPFSGDKKIIDPVDVLVVQRSSITDVNSEGDLSKFQKIHEMPYSKFMTLAKSLEKVKADNLAKDKETTNTFSKLASEKNDAYVSSIWFAYPSEGGQIQFCSRRGQDVNIAAFNGYMDGAPDSVFSYKEWGALQAKRIRINKSSFSRLYESLDAFYADLQNGKAPCNVFVDYPKDLLKIKDAITRDGLQQKLGYGTYVGNIGEVGPLSERYAKSKGFSSFSEYSFALDIKANSTQMKTLAASNIRNESTLNSIRSTIKKSGYSDNESVATVCQYLQDNDEAKKQGSTAKAIKESRESKERQQRAQKEKEDAAAKEKYEANRKAEWSSRCANYESSRKSCAGSANYSRCMDISYGGSGWSVDKDACQWEGK